VILDRSIVVVVFFLSTPRREIARATEAKKSENFKYDPHSARATTPRSTKK
jgi:hypothetical protein